MFNRRPQVVRGQSFCQWLQLIVMHKQSEMMSIKFYKNNVSNVDKVNHSNESNFLNEKLVAKSFLNEIIYRLKWASRRQRNAEKNFSDVNRNFR